MHSVSIRNLSKIYPGERKRHRGVLALNNFSMEIRDGEFVVLVGPSGCGKSTLMRMIAGLEDITSGDLYIDGRLVNDIEPSKRSVAMVFQSYALYPQMTVFQNIAFGIRLRRHPVAKVDEKGCPVLAVDHKKLRALETQLSQIEKAAARLSGHYQKKMTLLEKGHDRKAILDPDYSVRKAEGLSALEEISAQTAWKKAGLQKQISECQKQLVPQFELKRFTKAEIDAKVHQAAEILEIEELLDRKSNALSGGQKQRVALGRAVVEDAKVFLFDEPLSNLDAKLRSAMRSEIVKLHERLHAIFIYSTHDQVEAMTMGDRIVVLRDGLAQQIDTPIHLYDQPASKFVAGFIGSPQMNFLPAVLQSVQGKAILRLPFGSTLEVASIPGLDSSFLDGQVHSVLIGLRPEDLLISPQGIPARLVLSETLGQETILSLTLNDEVDVKSLVALKDQILVKAEGLVDLKPGVLIHLEPRPGKIHLFDPKTNKSLLSVAVGRG